jgi:hypothetical protein
MGERRDRQSQQEVSRWSLNRLLTFDRWDGNVYGGGAVRLRFLLKQKARCLSPGCRFMVGEPRNCLRSIIEEKERERESLERRSRQKLAARYLWKPNLQIYVIFEPAAQNVRTYHKQPLNPSDSDDVAKKITMKRMTTEASPPPRTCPEQSSQDFDADFDAQALTEFLAVGEFHGVTDPHIKLVARDSALKVKPGKLTQLIRPIWDGGNDSSHSDKG